MKHLLIAAIILGGTVLGLAPVTARAADGGICWSPILTETGTTGFGKTYAPQITNNTKFVCPGGDFTIKQLSQAGWIIANMLPVSWSTETTSGGQAIVKSRWQITIQK